MLFILPCSLQTDRIFPTFPAHQKGLDRPNPDDTAVFRNLKTYKIKLTCQQNKSYAENHLSYFTVAVRH
jgi:hypothetical protein